MKKKVLIMIGFTVLALNACKPEMEVSEEKSSLESKKVNGEIIHKFVINGNDTYVNEKDGIYYFADDIIISPDQFNYLKKLAVSGNSTIERSTISRSFAKTWPNGVVYYRIPDRSVLNRRLENTGRQLNDHDYTTFTQNIDRAMNLISSQTGIQFVERTDQDEYLYFQSNSEVNNSPIGWRAYSPQVLFNRVNIVSRDSPGIIAHEIMHSLGIMHEQCRPDRNQFVTINLENVLEDARHNFNIDPNMAAHGDFDFGSVMMYGSSDFAINPLTPVITRVDGNTYVKQRQRLSDGDYAGINHLYGPVNTERVTTFNIGSALGNNMNITNNGIANNQVSVPVILSDGTNNNNQRFVLHKTSEQGYYIIRSAEDATKVLTITGTTTGSAVELRRNTNSNAQKWLLENLGAQGYTFAPRNANDLRLEVNEGQIANGTAIVLGREEIINATTREISARQRFHLNRVN